MVRGSLCRSREKPLSRLFGGKTGAFGGRPAKRSPGHRLEPIHRSREKTSLPAPDEPIRRPFDHSQRRQTQPGDAASGHPTGSSSEFLQSPSGLTRRRFGLKMNAKEGDPILSLSKFRAGFDGRRSRVAPLLIRKAVATEILLISPSLSCSHILLEPVSFSL